MCAIEVLYFQMALPTGYMVNQGDLESMLQRAFPRPIEFNTSGSACHRLHTLKDLQLRINHQ